MLPTGCAFAQLEESWLVSQPDSQPAKLNNLIMRAHVLPGNGIRDAQMMHFRPRPQMKGED